MSSGRITSTKPEPFWVPSCAAAILSRIDYPILPPYNITNDIVIRVYIPGCTRAGWRLEVLMAKNFLPGGQKPRVEEPVSAGGVVYRRVDGNLEMVLCGRDSPVRWSLAKGTPDFGETLEQTALREVQEETGLEAVIEVPIKSINYWFSDKEGAVRFHKTVHFYLMKPVGGHTGLHDPEFDVVQWFSYDEALKNLTYANEVEVLRQALALIALREEGS